MTAVHLVVGEEEFLAERAVAEIVAEVRGASASPGMGASSIPVTTLAASEAGDAEYYEALSPSLFAEDRVVIVTGADNVGQAPAKVIVSAASDPVDGVTLVVRHSGGGRTKSMVGELRRLGAQVHECPAVKWPNERVDFVAAEFARHKRKVSRAVSALLVDSVRPDLRDLAAAVSQLVADTEGTITEQTVSTYYAGRAEVKGFEIAEKAVTGDLPGAVEALRWAEHLGVPHVLIADAVAEAIHDIALVAPHRGRSKFDLARDLGLAPFRAEKAQRAAASWKPAHIATGMEIAARLNGEVKGQAADANYALQRAVTTIATLARP